MLLSLFLPIITFLSHHYDFYLYPTILDFYYPIFIIPSLHCESYYLPTLSVSFLAALAPLLLSPFPLFWLFLSPLFSSILGYHYSHYIGIFLLRRLHKPLLYLLSFLLSQFHPPLPDSKSIPFLLFLFLFIISLFYLSIFLSKLNHKSSKL